MERTAHALACQTGSARTSASAVHHAHRSHRQRGPVHRAPAGHRASALPGPTRAGLRTAPARDRTLAAALLAGITLVNLMFWGPIPVLWLWVGSMVDYQSGSVSFGILVAFVGLLLMLLAGLSLMRRLDEAWILVRRAAGYDQRTGKLSVIFATTAVVGASAFMLWFLVLHGPGSNLFSPRA